MLVTLTLLVTSAQANSVVIGWAQNHSSTGGEFVMTPDNGPSFHTFCLERTEYISIGGRYTYTISNSTDGGANGPDPISIGTAWLYSNFLNHTLPGYTATAVNQDQLQNAIWYLENEAPRPGGGVVWVNAAQTALGPNVNLFSDANGAYGVTVWNLFDSNGRHCQSQLGHNVPDENTSTIALSLMAIPGLFLLRRKSVKTT